MEVDDDEKKSKYWQKSQKHHETQNEDMGDPQIRAYSFPEPITEQWTKKMIFRVHPGKCHGRYEEDETY